jgi:hypothetical protein
VLVPSFARGEPGVWACTDAGAWPSESRSARRASEFLRIDFKLAVGAGAGAGTAHSVSEPVGVGGSAVFGAGRGGGGTDMR